MGELPLADGCDPSNLGKFQRLCRPFGFYLAKTSLNKIRQTSKPRAAHGSIYEMAFRGADEI